jgi:hypothetical protein
MAPLIMCEELPYCGKRATPRKCPLSLGDRLSEIVVFVEEQEQYYYDDLSWTGPLHDLEVRATIRPLNSSLRTLLPMAHGDGVAPTSIGPWFS